MADRRFATQLWTRPLARPNPASVSASRKLAHTSTIDQRTTKRPKDCLCSLCSGSRPRWQRRPAEHLIVGPRQMVESGVGVAGRSRRRQEEQLSSSSSAGAFALRARHKILLGGLCASRISQVAAAQQKARLGSDTLLLAAAEML